MQSIHTHTPIHKNRIDFIFQLVISTQIHSILPHGGFKRDYVFIRIHWTILIRRREWRPEKTLQTARNNFFFLFWTVACKRHAKKMVFCCAENKNGICGKVFLFDIAPSLIYRKPSISVEFPKTENKIQFRRNLSSASAAAPHMPSSCGDAHKLYWQ